MIGNPREHVKVRRQCKNIGVWMVQARALDANLEPMLTTLKCCNTRSDLKRTQTLFSLSFFLSYLSTLPYHKQLKHSYEHLKCPF